MVKLTRIYTRTGDGGETGLGDGSRVPKHGQRVTAYGAVDEVNAVVGVARLHAVSPVAADLERIQNDLFDVGADLCTPAVAEPKFPPLRVSEPQVHWLEQRIDALNAELSKLASFVLPGGTAAAAHLHHARTVARRAERDITALAACDTVNPAALQYMNRLSDYFFVAARFANAQADGDVLWVPGKNR
ncbi:cob(I)yrinic acid a,c-diamide adenosyltransferase [Aquisalimonas sp.]|uniref:cob(I)yrinic acid a,c-diamide adenosyltransferase n=1 Tax=Aquisalimonas sp. TaxID=1872621 RepID=UPI0025BF27C2|nr:cob(I)yrinic acid a,c-diamide adenosyltransferase [Aquisalimonas sp.]